MELLKQFIDLILHLDKHLVDLVNQYQSWTYAILFLIIFAETGLVVTPFLPGDSLLFAVGALASKGELSVSLVVVLLILAAVIGDSVNYWIGRSLGPRVFSSESSRWFNRRHLDRTHAFYEKYGGKTLIFARFMPIVRTFAPFVAGIGKMTYPKFLAYSVSGGILWISLLTYAGYFFGEIPIVKRNFSLVIVAVIAISLLPAVVEFLKSWRSEKVES
ncbi:MAG: DedA family protein [Acidobacteria bacterium]|nr:DedA family protein [Acidobacteriota bacterium]